MTQNLFDKYMKLFNARSNVICTFGFSIKQYISASKIEFPDLSEKRRKRMFYLTTHSTHFIYGYMASDI